MKRPLALSAMLAAVLLFASPAWAPFHLLVIEQVFFGTEKVPKAQFVVLRTLAPGQVRVNHQQFTVQNADGSPAGIFGTFTRDLLLHFQTDVAMIAGTQEAQDLFCLPLDEIVSGSLAFPDGRVCFGFFDFFDGKGERPVDCVAYGNYTAATEPYLPPAMAPERDLALVRVDETDVNEDDFTLLPPMPQNNAGAVGTIDGVAGDADGSGVVNAADVEELSLLVFVATKRCDVTLARRGADANVDTRLNAADLIATADLATRGS